MTAYLHDKIALVTGAASGIGKATAQLFAQHGATVIVADLNSAQGHLVVDEIEAHGGTAEFFSLDVSDERHWQRVIEHIETRYSRLNILVNNAGIAFASSIEKLTFEQWRSVMSVNLDGVFLGTKYAISLMQNSQFGSIINVGSVSGLSASAEASAYCASKAGVIMFTKAAALECIKLHFPIRVNCICPGAVETPIWQQANWWPDFVKQMGGEKAAHEAIAKGVPIGRFASAAEIAEGILFLASDRSSYMTGTDLVMDGGLTAQ